MVKHCATNTRIASSSLAHVYIYLYVYIMFVKLFYISYIGLAREKKIFFFTITTVTTMAHNIT